jgi:4-hydroxy-tetrahydrodipicolinate synthase
MNLSGIVSYPITPFNLTDGKINFSILKQSIEQLISSDSDAIAPLGSTGESAYLSYQEWQEVAAFTVKIVASRIPVIVGISELTTEQAISKAQYAQEIGADAIMVIPVSYWKLSDQEIFAYYQDISNAVSLPIMVYNNPATSGVDMLPQLLVDMYQQIDNITMVKESTGDIQRIQDIHRLSAGKLPIFNGSNPLALTALCAGASGWCTAAPNLLDDLPKRLYNSIKQGDLTKAQALFYQQLPMLRFIVSSNIPRAIKAGLKLKGIDAGFPRKPLCGPTAEDLTSLEHLLADIK